MLDGLQYQPEAGYVGDDALTVSTQTNINSQDYSAASTLRCSSRAWTWRSSKPWTTQRRCWARRSRPTVTVSNNPHVGQLDATHVAVAENLPAGLTLLDHSTSGLVRSRHWNLDRRRPCRRPLGNVDVDAASRHPERVADQFCDASCDQFDRAADNNLSIFTAATVGPVAWWRADGDANDSTGADNGTC